MRLKRKRKTSEKEMKGQHCAREGLNELTSQQGLIVGGRAVDRNVIGRPDGGHVTTDTVEQLLFLLLV